jgi:hypothetical protein
MPNMLTRDTVPHIDHHLLVIPAIGWHVRKGNLSFPRSLLISKLPGGQEFHEYRYCRNVSGKLHTAT